MLNKLLLLMLLSASVTVSAQALKFGKINLDELEEIRYAKDSSASAAYLYKFRKTYFQYTPNSGLNLVTDIHERIKVYDSDGLDYGTKTISLYKTSTKSENVSGLKGATYNVVDSKIESTKLEKKNIFKSDISRNRMQVKMSFPNVKAGSIIEYQYKITSPYTQAIDELVFQTEIPIKKVKASVTMLDYFKFNIRTKGFLPLVPLRNTRHNSTLRINEVAFSYNLQDVPALKEENYVSNIKNYRAGVQFEIVSFEIPGSTYESFAKTWEDVVETIYESSRFGKELKKSSYFKDDLNELLQGATSDKEKAQRILSLVKEKVKWNNRGGYAINEGVKEAYKSGSGNVGDINLILISMLKYAGLETNPVLISTRNKGIPLFPTLDGFNYVVASTKIDGEYCMLDASDAYGTIDVLPTKTLNWYGRKISDDGNSEMFELSPKNISKDVVMMSVKLNDDGSIQGKYRQRYDHHNALVFRNKYYKGSEENYLDDLEKSSNGLEISEFSVKQLGELDKHVEQSFEFLKPDMVESVSGKLIFNPLFHLTETENPFKAKEREYPVDYAYPWEDAYTVMIEIPQGYKVDYLPKPTAIALPENIGSFKYNISQRGNTIFLKASIKINSAIVAPHNYVYLKEFYTKLIEKETDKVVLSKISENEHSERTTSGR